MNLPNMTEPDPQRMLKAYAQSVSTELLNALENTQHEHIAKSVEISNVIKNNYRHDAYFKCMPDSIAQPNFKSETNFYVSHEALFLLMNNR